MILLPRLVTPTGKKMTSSAPKTAFGGRPVRDCARVNLAHYLLSLSLPPHVNPGYLLQLHFYLPPAVMGQICSSLSSDLGYPNLDILTEAPLPLLVCFFAEGLPTPSLALEV